jgi:hypothetical protein
MHVNLSFGGLMPRPFVSRSDRRGITVLGLVLLIIAIVVAVVLLTRYYPV